MSKKEEPVKKKKKGEKPKEKEGIKELKKRKNEIEMYSNEKRIKQDMIYIGTDTDTNGNNHNDKNCTMNDLIPPKIPNLSRNLQTSLSIVIPSSMINIRSDIIKSYLSSHLARICTVFSIANIYIYDDEIRNEKKTLHNSHEEKEKETVKNKNKMNSFEKVPNYSYSCAYLHYNLQYLETPQYMRKHLFPISNFLKHAGIMNPLCAPHHLQSDEWLPFREGVVIKKTMQGLLVDVGLFTNAIVPFEQEIPVGTRVTILFDDNAYKIFEQKNKDALFKGKLINPNLIPETYNVYWGYKTEILKRVSDVFKIKKDYLIGTSERGEVLHSNSNVVPFQQKKNILIVFGNKDGLEDLLIKEREEEKNKIYSPQKKEKVLKKILKKFDLFINTCHCQTSRTIRTEEAITITISLIHNMLL